MLLDYGLAENIVEKLVSGGIPTVERLGQMTPEELEAIPGIGPDLVEHIRDVVVSYYGQYDEASEVQQDSESQEQQPTLEMGEEGYNIRSPPLKREQQCFRSRRTPPSAPITKIRSRTKRSIRPVSL